MEKFKISHYFLFTAILILSALQAVAQAPTAQAQAKPSPAPAVKVPTAAATTTPAPAAKPAIKSSQGQVLDFEGEVIEGERRRPDLFLQMSIENVKFDSLMYQREDFNDYLEVDRKSRNRFLRYK